MENITSFINILLSKWDPILPGEPWFSKYAPSIVGQLKNACILLAKGSRANIVVSYPFTTKVLYKKYQ